MLKDRIIEYSQLIGIEGIGFTDVEMCPELKEKLELQKKLGYRCTFQKGEIESAINPKLIMDNAKSIIAIFASYSKTCDRLENITPNEVYFSSSSWGIDYHVVLKQKLELLAKYLKEIEPNFQCEVIVDTSPLCDRTIAYKAGLGFFGKNNLLINEKYGSYIFLGSILTNLEIEKDSPKHKGCMECNKCIEACPTKAINDSGILNSRKCISYLTQKKGELSNEEQSFISNCIYGCDICMRVCPYNCSNNSTNKEFIPTDLEFINIDDYKPLSNKQFKLKYGHLAGSWRGGRVIERNMNIYVAKRK